MLHARLGEAEAIIAAIERRVRDGAAAPPGADGAHPARHSRGARRWCGWCWRSCATIRSGPFSDLVLMAAQAFFYNAIFFSYALVLTRFYAVPSAAIGWYILPFALGNFLGPLLLGPLFDALGRKPMIAVTYALVGGAAGDRRVSVSRGNARCGAADRVLDRDLLLRLGGGECRLPDGQRELSARGPGAGDCVILRDRHRARRGCLALAVRDAGRLRRARRRLLRLSPRRGADDRAPPSSRRRSASRPNDNHWKASRARSRRSQIEIVAAFRPRPSEIHAPVAPLFNPASEPKTRLARAPPTAG